MALPLQELISPPQKETSPQTSPLPQEEISLPPRETLLPQDDISPLHREGTSLGKKETSPPEKKRLSRDSSQLGAPIVSEAAKALAEKDIPIVEYGSRYSGATETLWSFW
ncbi:hypothetical protein N7461_005026 [Penicillium sp. DV-2018c]|nr:hypothetical protein N7461_005026 [Penicillium sp. DV-2018c]